MASPTPSVGEVWLRSGYGQRRRCAEVDGIAVEHRLQPRELEVFKRGLQIRDRRRLFAVRIDGNVALNIVDPEHRLQRIDNGGAGLIIMHRTGVVNYPRLVIKSEVRWERWLRCRGRGLDGRCFRDLLRTLARIGP